MKEILRFVVSEYGANFSIRADCAFNTCYLYPPKIDGHIPDVYAAALIDERIVIGEAKTPIDLESPRTQEQLTAFINFLDKHQGSTFILATQWGSINSAKSIVRSIFRRNNITNVAARYIDSYQ